MRADAAEFVPSSATAAKGAAVAGAANEGCELLGLLLEQRDVHCGGDDSIAATSESTACAAGAASDGSNGAGCEGLYYGRDGEARFPDLETFLTPQILDPRRHRVDGEKAPAAVTTAPAGAEESASAEAPTDDQPDPNASLAETEAEGASDAEGTGTLRVESRRLLWSPFASLEEAAETLAATPKGRSLPSPPFWAAGAELRLAFYPHGSSLSGDEECSVELVCEDKAKLKFELFLNGRSSGRKVLMGRRFSCDFRAVPRGSTAVELPIPEVSVEVHENLLCTGFF